MVPHILCLSNCHLLHCIASHGIASHGIASHGMASHMLCLSILPHAHCTGSHGKKMSSVTQSLSLSTQYLLVLVNAWEWLRSAFTHFAFTSIGILGYLSPSASSFFSLSLSYTHLHYISMRIFYFAMTVFFFCLACTITWIVLYIHEATPCLSTPSACFYIFAWLKPASIYKKNTPQLPFSTPILFTYSLWSKASADHYSPPSSSTWSSSCSSLGITHSTTDVLFLVTFCIYQTEERTFQFGRTPNHDGRQREGFCGKWAHHQTSGAFLSTQKTLKALL